MIASTGRSKSKQKIRENSWYFQYLSSTPRVGFSAPRILARRIVTASEGRQQLMVLSVVSRGWLAQVQAGKRKRRCKVRARRLRCFPPGCGSDDLLSAGCLGGCLLRAI
uniref:Uncharacterized protein n=1 Tax=Oryza rufipogon TaxID=4529 RepID=A0A0E0R520_ORYRU